jgi:hypothetical protein
MVFDCRKPGYNASFSYLTTLLSAAESPMMAELRLAESLREELTSCELLGMSLVRAVLPQGIHSVYLVFRFMI